MSAPGLSIEYGGPTGRMLNPFLVERMGLDQKRIDALLASHVERLRLFDEMKSAPSRSLLRLARQFDDLEFHQQRLWGFAMDRDRHLWWSVPRCSCPKDVNENLGGTPLRVVHECCEVHGPLLCAVQDDCALCPSSMPVADGWGNIHEWTDVLPGHRVVNVDCSEHGVSLASFRPPGR